MAQWSVFEKRVKWKQSQTAAANAGRVLPALVEQYFEAGRKASDGRRSPKQLHKFRIATKQFRYSLEQFRLVYGVALDRRLDAVRGLQSVLGKLHDYQAIAEMLGEKSPLQARLQRSLKKKLKEFHKQWAAFDANGQLKRWKKFLAADRAKGRAVPQSARARKGRRKPLGELNKINRSVVPRMIK